MHVVDTFFEETLGMRTFISADDLFTSDTGENYNKYI